jgi:hypothetical protein
VALSNELQQFGFIESQNLTMDFRIYGQHIELLSKYAEELADVIVDRSVVTARAIRAG